MRTLSFITILLLGSVSIGLLRAADPGNIGGPITTDNLTVRGTSSFSNTLYMVSNLVETSSSIIAVPAQVLDLNACPKQILSLTNNVTLTFTNLPDATHSTSVSVKFIADGTSRSVIIPNEIVKLSGSNTNVVLANKIGILSLTFFGNNQTNAVAAWSAQP